MGRRTPTPAFDKTPPRFDNPADMNLDLEMLLKGWEHEPGQIKVRKVAGLDGREKLQLRIDLGLIQMNVTGRPDGQEPYGCESLLAYHQERARDAESSGDEFTLTGEECGELQQEGIQYYHRYISLFQLNDFEGVIRDTARNLELFDFIGEYAENDEVADSLEQFRPYVLMMHSRARAARALDQDDFVRAIAEIEKGRKRIVEFYRDSENPDAADHSPEVEFLDEWLKEVRAKRPLTRLEVMRQEMDHAIASEAYERAAELRDAIRAYEEKPVE